MSPGFPNSLARFAMKRPLLFVLCLTLLLGSGSGMGNLILSIIDPGHGGHDRGGRPASGSRKSPLHPRRRPPPGCKVLRAAGFHVVLTRDADYFVEPAGNVPRHGQCPAKRRLCQRPFQQRTAPPPPTVWRPTTTARRAPAWPPSSIAGSSQVSGLPDRHVRRRGFFVIRNTRIPAILIEPGFLNGNPQSADRISAIPPPTASNSPRPSPAAS